MHSILDSMNAQVHETTGHSPYKLVLGQKPHATIFPGGDATMMTKHSIFVDKYGIFVTP